MATLESKVVLGDSERGQLPNGREVEVGGSTGVGGCSEMEWERRVRPRSCLGVGGTRVSAGLGAIAVTGDWENPSSGSVGGGVT